MCDVWFKTNSTSIIIWIDEGRRGREREGERRMEDNETFVDCSEWSKCRDNLRKRKSRREKKMNRIMEKEEKRRKREEERNE